MLPPPPRSTLFPYTTLFRSSSDDLERAEKELEKLTHEYVEEIDHMVQHKEHELLEVSFRSEEHTSELQSRFDLVCRLLLEKKKPEPSTTTVLQPIHYVSPRD